MENHGYTIEYPRRSPRISQKIFLNIRKCSPRFSELTDILGDPRRHQDILGYLCGANSQMSRPTRTAAARPTDSLALTRQWTLSPLAATAEAPILTERHPPGPGSPAQPPPPGAAALRLSRRTAGTPIRWPGGAARRGGSPPVTGNSLQRPRSVPRHRRTLPVLAAARLG